MSTSKKTATKKTNQPSLFEKISGQATHLKEKLMEEKDHVAEMAGHAMDSIKEKIHDMRQRSASAKKKIVKKAVKKVAKKSVKKAVKKAVKVVKKKIAKKSAPVAKKKR